MTPNILALRMDFNDFMVNDSAGAESILKTACVDNEQLLHAELPGQDDMAQHGPENFALVLYSAHQGAFKKFAMYTPALTEVNLNTFAAVKDTLPEQIRNTVGYNLTKAAEFFKVKVPDSAKGEYTDPGTNIVDISKVQLLQKEADAATYALPDQERYPLNGEQNIKEAMYFFEQSWPKMSVDERIEYAYNVSSAAKTASVDVDPSLRVFSKYASLTSNLNPGFPDAMFVRMSYIGNKDHMQAYQGLMEKAAELSTSETITLLEALDKESGISKHWNSRFPDPVMSVLAVEKTAGVSFKGREIPGPEFTKRVGLMKYELLQVLDSKLVEQLVLPNGFTVFGTLPIGVQEIIMRKVGL